MVRGQSAKQHVVRGQSAKQHVVRGQSAKQHVVRGQSAKQHVVRGQSAKQHVVRALMPNFYGSIFCMQAWQFENSEVKLLAFVVCWTS